MLKESHVYMNVDQKWATVVGLQHPLYSIHIQPRYPNYETNIRHSNQTRREPYDQRKLKTCKLL